MFMFMFMFMDMDMAQGTGSWRREAGLREQDHGERKQGSRNGIMGPGSWTMCH